MTRYLTTSLRRTKIEIQRSSAPLVSSEELAQRVAVTLATLGILLAVTAIALWLKQALIATVTGGMLLILASGSGMVHLVAFRSSRNAYLAGVIAAGFGLPLAYASVLSLLPFWHPILFVYSLIAFGLGAVSLRALNLRQGGAVVFGATIAALRTGLCGGTLVKRPARGTLCALLLLLAGTISWLLSLIQTNSKEPPIGGLLATVSPLWYVGIVCTVVPLIWTSTLGRAGRGAALVQLFLIVEVSPAIIYGNARATTGTKHVGVIELILHNHAAYRSIDIYNAWPGMFAAIALLASITHLRDFFSLLPGWPIFIGAFRCVSFLLLARRFSLSSRATAFALAIFILGSETVGQDYFSPQSIGTVLVLSMTYLCIENVSGATSQSLGRGTVLLVAGVGLAVTHQLSPYEASLAILVFTVFKLSPTWSIIPVLLPAVAWAAINIRYVREFAGTSTVGRVANFRPPQTVGGSGRMLIVAGQSAALVFGFIIVALLAGIGLVAVRGWNRRDLAATAVCGIVPVLLVAANPYGGEGVFRFVLFSFPWVAILAARLVDAKSTWIRDLLLASGPVLLTANLCALYLQDGISSIRSKEVAVTVHYGRLSPETSLLAVVGGGDPPLTATASYYQIHGERLDVLPVPTDAGISSLTKAIQADALSSGYHAAYIMFTTTCMNFSEEYGLIRRSQYLAVWHLIRDSTLWVPVVSNSDAGLYRLREMPTLRNEGARVAK